MVVASGDVAFAQLLPQIPAGTAVQLAPAASLSSSLAQCKAPTRFDRSAWMFEIADRDHVIYALYDARATRGDDRLISSWKLQARRELIELRKDSSAWSYRRNHVPSVEPTGLACLGMLASGDEGTSNSDIATSHEAAGWMAAIQRSDGSLPVSEGLLAPAWATPYALVLWNALSGYQEARWHARTWLLGSKGQTLSSSKNTDNIIGHDPSLVGWPWVEGTHSWLEPTALAILALCSEGLADHPRVKAGIKLILDRALEAGGWNYGNKSVFGSELRPQPGPTGLALLALAAVGLEAPSVARAVAYLRELLPNVRASVSLGWGVLGLRAHHALPMEAETWLEETHAKCTGKPDAAMGLGLLLLASSERALSLILTPGSSRAG